MTEQRIAKETVGFVDVYCEQYRGLFGDVRSYEYFKLLHIGMLSELPRKSLPAIAKAVGEADSQGLHNFISEGRWAVEDLRETRLGILKGALGGRKFVLCIDETGDKKKGRSTDYVARQYIGNLGKVENGMVSVNAYGVLDNLTFPLIFSLFKPEKRLKRGDTYRTKPELAIALIRELRQRGFQFDLVLADCLYGESTAFIAALEQLKLAYVVSLRDNHGVWMAKGERIRQTRWLTFERVFSDGMAQTRYLSEVIFGKRGDVRYFYLTTDPVTLPPATTCFVMTNLTGNLRHTLGNCYGLRTWIEYGFKQVKNELGWADYRLTDHVAIERWWEIVCSTYTLVCLHAPVFQAADTLPTQALLAQHPAWKTPTGWKTTLNNLRLLIQPFLALWILLPWLAVFPIARLILDLHCLVDSINAVT